MSDHSKPRSTAADLAVIAGVLAILTVFVVAGSSRAITRLVVGVALLGWVLGVGAVAALVRRFRR